MSNEAKDENEDKKNPSSSRWGEDGDASSNLMMVDDDFIDESSSPRSSSSDIGLSASASATATATANSTMDAAAAATSIKQDEIEDETMCDEKVLVSRADEHQNDNTTTSTMDADDEGQQQQQKQQLMNRHDASNMISETARTTTTTRRRMNDLGRATKPGAVAVSATDDGSGVMVTDRSSVAASLNHPHHSSSVSTARKTSLLSSSSSVSATTTTTRPRSSSTTRLPSKQGRAEAEAEASVLSSSVDVISSAAAPSTKVTTNVPTETTTETFFDEPPATSSSSVNNIVRVVPTSTTTSDRAEQQQEHEDEYHHHHNDDDEDVMDQAATSTANDETTTTTTTSLPVAREYQEIPLISYAELIPDTTTVALSSSVPIYHVDIDGGRPNSFMSRTSISSARMRTAIHDGNENDNNKRRSSFVTWITTRSRRFWMIAFGVLVVMLIVIISITILVTTTSTLKEDTTTTISPSSSPTFPYPCFTSTLALLDAQEEAARNSINTDTAHETSVLLPEPLILCPNTWIVIGRYRNAAQNDFAIEGGDYPIHVRMDNVTIQCGLDGRRENNCTLDGGLLQVNTQGDVYHPTLGWLNDYSPVTTNHMVIRGLTFTGQIQGSGPFLGIGMTISSPGKNIRFEDCAWKNFQATNRVIGVGRNYIMGLKGEELASQSIEVTFSKCLFSNVSYNEEFLVSFQQAIHLENCIFRNIRLNSILIPPECSIHPNGCRNLLHCRAGDLFGENTAIGNLPTVCSIHNICVEHVATAGAGPIVISHDTLWSSSGINTWSGPVEDVNLAQVRNAMGYDDYCALGVARVMGHRPSNNASDDTPDADEDQSSTTNYSCLEEPVFQLVTAATEGEEGESSTCIPGLLD